MRTIGRVETELKVLAILVDADEGSRGVASLDYMCGAHHITSVKGVFLQTRW